MKQWCVAVSQISYVGQSSVKRRDIWDPTTKSYHIHSICKQCIQSRILHCVSTLLLKRWPPATKKMKLDFLLFFIFLQNGTQKKRYGMLELPYCPLCIKFPSLSDYILVDLQYQVSLPASLYTLQTSLIALSYCSLYIKFLNLPHFYTQQIFHISISMSNFAGWLCVLGGVSRHHYIR